VKINDFTIGVHYHGPFFRDPKGDIFIFSGLGLWLQSFSYIFKKVVYIGHQTKNKMPYQDFKIEPGKGIEFISIGLIGGIWKLPVKIYNTRKVIRSLNQKLDALIVRVPTPRQETILKNFNKRNKAILLIGDVSSIDYSLKALKRRGLKASLISLISLWRKTQIKRISKECVVFSNSKKICDEFKRDLNKLVYYCPTSSIKREDFFYVSDRCNKESVKLLFVGRICIDKGVFEVLEAVHYLKERHHKISLQIAGECSGFQKLDIFKNYAEKLGISEDVLWKGRVPFGKQLFSIYSESDILILPTNDTEGFPRVIVEAMANGVLVITTKVAGIPYVCSHKKEVYFVEKSGKAIADAVEDLISNPILREKMLRRGYEFAKERLWGENERKMAEILEKEWL
jgi:glycosyltransferase involved in cell wall biosynthesis